MIKFLKLQEEYLEMILAWRIKPEISQYLLTDVENDMEKQHQWFDRISKDDTYRYWIIAYQDIPIGLMNLSEIDPINLRCCAGYYIGELKHRQLGAMIPPYLYNYIFQEMKFRKTYGEIFSENESIIKIHEMHGYHQVGVYRDHLFKNDQFHDIILIELLSEVWLAQKKYQRYIAKFD